MTKSKLDIIVIIVGFVLAFGFIFLGACLQRGLGTPYVEVDATVISIEGEDPYIIEYEYTYKKVDYRALNDSYVLPSIGEK